MTTVFEELPPSPNQSLSPEFDMAELDPSSIAMVAGGINPQPLPPERAQRLD